jgi:hypothetical protein
MLVRLFSLVFVLLFVAMVAGCGGGGTTTTIAPPGTDLAPTPSVEVVRFQGNWVPVVDNKIHVGDVVDFRPVTATAKGGSGVITDVDMLLPDGTHSWGPHMSGGYLIGMAGKHHYSITLEGVTKPIVIDLVSVMPMGIVPKNPETNDPLFIHNNGNYLCDAGMPIKLTIDGKVKSGQEYTINQPDGTEITRASDFIPRQVGWYEITCKGSPMPPMVRLEVRATGIYGFG